MRHGRDDVGALGLHLRHILFRRCDDVGRDDLARKVGAVPLYDLRRHESDDADADRTLRAVLCRYGTVEAPLAKIRLPARSVRKH